MDLQYIKGIGPQRAEALEASGIHSLEDLLQYYPRKYLDASAVVQLRVILQHLRENVTVRGRVLRKQLFDGKKPHRLVITLQDDSGGTLDLAAGTIAADTTIIAAGQGLTAAPAQGGSVLIAGDVIGNLHIGTDAGTGGTVTLSGIVTQGKVALDGPATADILSGGEPRNDPVG